MRVWVAGRRVTVATSRSIGKGGEADVYGIGHGLALKLFKPPDHPDLAGDPAAQAAAASRIEEHQSKLPAFPSSLPTRVVVPVRCATDAAGRIVGYTMRLVDDAEPMARVADPTRRRADIDGARAVALLDDLRRSLAALHAAGVVAGDLNDLNVLVKNREAHVIDADSFQFGPFPCRVYTERFVDPTLCDPAAPRPLRVRPPSLLSDWYAFAVLFFRSLLCVDPFGGVHRPAGPAARVPAPRRALARLTVRAPGVKLPRAALPLETLPVAHLDYCERVFARDLREPFPAELLAALRFQRCAGCGLEHARDRCPTCAPALGGKTVEMVRVRGRVTATGVLRTKGRIMWAALEGTKLRWAVAEGTTLRREHGTRVAVDPELLSHPRLRTRIQGDATWLGYADTVLGFGPRQGARIDVERCHGEPVFDAAGPGLYWVSDGGLWRDGSPGPVRVGDVLADQTRIYVGPRFGFGLARAGNLSLSFVFTAAPHSINDGVALPRIAGELVRTAATLTDDRCWFFTASQDGGRRRHDATLISDGGAILARATADEDDGSWLGSFESVAGAHSAGPFLLVPTDDGIARVEVQSGGLGVARMFPDTAPFLSPGCRLLPGGNGIHVIGAREIVHLRIA